MNIYANTYQVACAPFSGDTDIYIYIDVDATLVKSSWVFLCALSTIFILLRGHDSSGDSYMLFCPYPVPSPTSSREASWHPAVMVAPLLLSPNTAGKKS